MDQYNLPDRVSRMELRRLHPDRGFRRSVSLDAQGRSSPGHHYDNHSLGGESYDDDYYDQRCQSPLPCDEGCRDLLSKLMSPMISSIAIDQSISLRRGEFPRSFDPPRKESEEKPKLTENISQPESKQSVYAARKSVRELYGRPSWWGDDDSVGGDDDRTEKRRSLSRTYSAEPTKKLSHSDVTPITPPGQGIDIKPSKAFMVNLDIASEEDARKAQGLFAENGSKSEEALKGGLANVGQENNRKPAEAFTVDLDMVTTENKSGAQEAVREDKKKSAEAFIIDSDVAEKGKQLKCIPKAHFALQNDSKSSESGTDVADSVIKATPVRHAEAFTIDLAAGGGRKSASGSVCVPERLRRALQERQQLQRKHSTPTGRPTTAPAAKKLPTRRIGDSLLTSSTPVKSGQPAVTKAPVRLVTGISRSQIASPVTSPINVPKRTPETKPVASKVDKPPGVPTTIEKKELANPKTSRPPNPLTQRNRIPLRQAPSRTPVTTNGMRKPPASRIEGSRASPSLSASPSVAKASNPPNLPGTLVEAPVQSNRIPLKRRSGPISAESGVKRPVGSPLTRRVNPSVCGGRQATPTRTEVSENKRVPSATQNSARLVKAPAVPSARGAVATSRPKSTRPLFNSIKKPITTTTTTSPNTSPGGNIALPTKPTFNGSTLCDPLVQEIWSYKEAKDYVMEKMFQGIAATYNAVTASKSTTQSVFEEFKVAVAQSAATTAAIKAAAGLTPILTKPKIPVICTPEERKELELFERVEAEIDKFGEDEEEALAQALSPLVEDFSRTWIRGKNVSKSVEISHTPIEKLPVVDDPTDANLATQVMSTAASTVTLENPLTLPEDHKADPDSLQNAQSVQSIAETYVLDATDTLAAEGIPPVVIYDSPEKLHMQTRGEPNIMETSNTCTIPYQGTMTPRSGTPILDGEPEEVEALEIFEREINEEFKAEADSLSGSEDLESKSNRSGGGLLPRNSEHQDPSTVPEYLVKAPCWTEKRKECKKSLSTSNSDAAKKIETHLASFKNASSLESPPFRSTESGVAIHEGYPIMFSVTSRSQTAAVSTTSAPKISPTNPAPMPHGRIFVADDSSDFLNALASSSTSSSSSSPLIDHFKDEFLQPEIPPMSAVLLPTAHTVTSTYDKKGATDHQRNRSVNTHRSWGAENNSPEETWSQLRRHASRCSIQSEYGECGRSQRIGSDHGQHHRHRNPSMWYGGLGVKKNSDAIYPFAAGQQAPIIRSTHSTASLDTALLLRDSQEALNEIARRIYRQPTHPTVPATPIQLPQLQNLSSYLAHRYTESNVDKNSANEKHPPLPLLSQLAVGDLGTQSIDRSLVGGRSANRTPGHYFTPVQPQGNDEARQSSSNMPYSPPMSAPPISPISIASATEPGHPFRNGRRAKNSNRYVVRRHSLRSSNHQRADSPTPNDIFPSEHTNAIATHAPTGHKAAKVVTEVKVTPSRPTGLSVTTTVAPLVLQRRPEAETKACPAVAITPIIRGSQPANIVTDASIGGSSSFMKTSLTEETHGGSLGGIAKPVPHRFDAPPEEVLRGSAFTTVAASRVSFRPTELCSTDPSERCRRSMSLGPVDTVGADVDEILPLHDSSDKNYEALLAASILRLSNRLRRCSDNLAQRIGAPSSDANSPVASSYWKGNLKSSTSLHQELNDSLSNMRTVEQQLQYMENVLFGGHGSVGNANSTCARSKSSTETDYLQELERINNELRGFVPIGAGGVNLIGERDTTTEISHVSTEATDSGLDASIAAGRGSDVKDPVPVETTSGCAVRRSDEDPTFSNGDFY